MEAYSNFVYGLTSAFSWTSRTVGVALLYQVPTDIDPALAPSVNNLVTLPGFQELNVPGYARMTEQVAEIRDLPLVQVVVGSDIDIPNTESSYVAAAVFYINGTVNSVVNPWLFVTNVCFDNVVTPGSRIVVGGSPQVLFSYVIQTPRVIAAQGQIIQAPGPLEWEPSRMYHLYIYPERVNWIPNPSFEDVGLFGWRANGTMTRMTPGVDNAANHFLRVAGTRLECIPSPSYNRQHRVSAYIRSAPTGGATWVQLGLSCSNYVWSQQADVLGPQRLITSSSWTHLDAVVNPLENTAGTEFIVVSDGAFDIDLAMMGDIPDLNAYFDGDNENGAVGDFSWQGVAHQSYSCWYNNRYLVGARLFGHYIEGQVTQKGLVYDWIPVDSAIATHWDVMSANDTKHPLKDWAARSIP